VPPFGLGVALVIGEAQFVPFCKKCFAFLLREQKFSKLDLLACTPKLAGKILAGENFGVCSLHAEKTFLPLGLFATNAGHGGVGIFSLRGAGIFDLSRSPPPFKYQRRTRQALRLVVLASFARFHQFAHSSPFFNFLWLRWFKKSGNFRTLCIFADGAEERSPEGANHHYTWPIEDDAIPPR